MLHTKFQGHRPLGSREEDFLRFLIHVYMGMAVILVMWPGPFETTFVPLFHGDSIWNLASICPVVSEEKMFKECGRRTDDGRRRPTYPVSSPVNLRGWWANKRKAKRTALSCIPYRDFHEPDRGLTLAMYSCWPQYTWKKQARSNSQN